MALGPGQHVKGGAVTDTYTAAETVSPGDALALDTNDEVIPANSGDSEVVFGIAGYNKDGSDYASGDDVLVTLAGVVVANVASGVAGGVEVAASGTDGELAAGSGPKGIMTAYSEGSAKFDEGNKDLSIDSGYAPVAL
jgi:hypothetical protein